MSNATAMMASGTVQVSLDSHKLMKVFLRNNEFDNIKINRTLHYYLVVYDDKNKFVLLSPKETRERIIKEEYSDWLEPDDFTDKDWWQDFVDYLEDNDTVRKSVQAWFKYMSDSE